MIIARLPMLRLVGSCFASAFTILLVRYKTRIILRTCLKIHNFVYVVQTYYFHNKQVLKSRRCECDRDRRTWWFEGEDFRKEWTTSRNNGSFGLYITQIGGGGRGGLMPDPIFLSKNTVFCFGFYSTQKPPKRAKQQ